MNVLRALFGENAKILRDRNFQALLLANILPPLGAAPLSPILDSLIGPFGTSPANIGLMISFFTAPAIVLIPVAGSLSDRYGRKPVLVIALVLFGIAGAAIALTTNFRVVLGLRLLQGVAFGGMTPVIITSLGDIYAGETEATAQGIRFTGSGLTHATFPLISGSLVVLAWQYPFLLYLIAIPIAGVVLYWFEEPTDRDEDASQSKSSQEESKSRAFLALVRQPRVIALVLARGMPLFVWIGFLTYNSIIVVQVLDGTSTQAGALVTVASIVYAAAASQTGRITAMFDSRYYPLLAATVCQGAGFVVFVMAPTLLVAGVGITVTGVGFGITLAMYRSIITGLASESLRGSVVSLAEANGRIVATATPILIGTVITVTTPRLSLIEAVQLAGTGIAVLGTVGGVICLVVARVSPPVRQSR